MEEKVGKKAREGKTRQHSLQDMDIELIKASTPHSTKPNHRQKVLTPV
jgi:hypothetical protein